MPVTERHPWEPFAPQGAKILFLGSFPPPRARWSMEFYYPNITNDFWRIMGLLFFGNKEHFIIKEEKRFKEQEIKEFLTDKKIALFDTSTEVRRLKENASDKFLETVTPTDLHALTASMPHCTAIAATGQKAAEAVAAAFGCEVPPIGTAIRIRTATRELNFHRLPSTSRAYPLAVEKKAEYYKQALACEDIL